MPEKIDVKEFLCPSCGGTMVFDPHTQMICCSQCDNTYPVNKHTNIDSKKTLQCPNCGTVMEFNALNLSIDCPACDSSFIVKKIENSDELKKDDFIIPFSTTQENYQKSFVSWLAEGEFVPNDIFDEIHFITQQGVYIPIYQISGTYSVQYTASIGYDRIEQYETTEKVYDNGHSYNKRVIKERTVTDWRPFSSTMGGDYSVYVCATDYFSKLREHAPVVDDGGVDEIAAIPAFCEQNGIHGQPQEYDRGYTAGFVTLPINIGKENAYANSGKEKVQNIISQKISSNAPGDHIKDIDWHGKVERNYTCIYRPFWLTKYSYNGDAYCNIADGTDLSAHAGSRPFDTQRRKSISRFFLPLKIAIGLAIFGLIEIPILLTDLGDFEVLPAIGIALLIDGILVLGAYLYGYIRRKSLLTKNTSYRKNKAAAILKDMSAFFSRKSDLNESDTYIGAVDKKWKLTPEEIQKRNKDPRVLLKSFRWFTVGMAAFMLCLDIFLSAVTGAIDSLSFSLLYMLMLLPAIIPYFIYIRKVRKIDNTYEPKKDYGIIGGILLISTLLTVIGTLASANEKEPAATFPATISQPSDIENSSPSTTAATLHGESTYLNNPEEASTSHTETVQTSELVEEPSQIPPSTNQENNGEKSSSSTTTMEQNSPSSTPITQTSGLTAPELARMWENGCQLSGTLFHLNDWNVLSTGDTVSISGSKGNESYFISCSDDKRYFTASCPYLYPSETDDFCYAAVSAFTGFDTSDTRWESFYQLLETHLEMNGSTSKSVFTYGGCTVTFVQTEIDHLGNECTVTIQK